MDESRTVLAALLAAFVLVGLLSVTTATETLLAVTPLGFATLLLVGVALPQFLLARRDGSAMRRGVAVLATAAAGVALVASVPAFLEGGVPAALLSPADGWFLGSLAVAVLGAHLGIALREGIRGYRATRG